MSRLCPELRNVPESPIKETSTFEAIFLNYRITRFSRRRGAWRALGFKSYSSALGGVFSGCFAGRGLVVDSQSPN